MDVRRAGYANRRQYLLAMRIDKDFPKPPPPGTEYYVKEDGLVGVRDLPPEPERAQPHPLQTFTSHTMVSKGKLFKGDMALELIDMPTFYLTWNMRFLVHRVRNTTPKAYPPFMWELCRINRFSPHGTSTPTGYAAPVYRAKTKRNALIFLHTHAGEDPTDRARALEANGNVPTVKITEPPWPACYRDYEYVRVEGLADMARHYPEVATPPAPAT